MRGMFVSLLLAALTPFPSFVHTQTSSAAQSTGVARGEYIVKDVAMCWTCHTPPGPDGLPDQQRWLLGGPVPFQPARATATWAIVAPRLAGLPPGTDEEFIKLMMTGIARTGSLPKPPMPQFRMTRPDAEAVLAYLKSIKN